MASADYIRSCVEAVAKRTKPILAAYAVRELVKAEEKYDSATARCNALQEERDKLKLEVARLASIRTAVDAVLALKAKPIPSPNQLTMLLQSEELDTGDDKDLEPAAAVLTELLDKSYEISDDYEGITPFQYEAALDAAFDDRAAMLKRLGLSEREWAAQGGASYTDFEIARR